MAELEQTQALKDEVNQLKEQLAKMMEMLQSMQTERNTNGNPSSSNERNPATPLYPPGFTHFHFQTQGPNPQRVMMPLNIYSTRPPITNTQETQAQQFPPYGLPPNYTPPEATETQDANPTTTQTQPSNTTNNEPQQNQPPFTTNTPFIFPPNYDGTTPLVIPTANPQATANSNEAQATLNTYPFYMPQNFPHPVAGAIPPFENPQSKGKLEILEERLRAVEGSNSYGLRNAVELCLVPDVVIPPKFKVPEFVKYRGTTCPKNHLTMYVRKMASCAYDDKLLIHFFQDSLTGAALNWYMHLERAHIRCFKDLADAFLKQYKYNIDMAPDRSQLQNMVKGDAETLKEYAQRWREIAAQVEPPLSEKEMIAMFINTLQSPFYDRMIGSVSSNFSDIVIIGERVESGMRSGKIIENTTGAVSTKRPSSLKKSEGEAHAITFDHKKFSQGKPNQMTINPQSSFQTLHIPYHPSVPYPQPYHPYIATVSQVPYLSPSIPYHPPVHTQNQIPQPFQTWSQNPNPNQGKPLIDKEKKPIKFDPIPMTYTELLPDLISKSLLIPRPVKPIEPPYPKWFNPNAKCDYHAGAIGHSTENCNALKHKVQELIDTNWLCFKEKTPNVGHNPLPNHGNPEVSAIEETGSSGT